MEVHRELAEFGRAAEPLSQRTAGRGLARTPFKVTTSEASAGPGGQGLGGSVVAEGPSSDAYRGLTTASLMGP